MGKNQYAAKEPLLTLTFCTESDRKALDALVAACKDGGVSGAIGGGAAANTVPAASAFQV